MKRRRILRLSAYLAGGAITMPIVGSFVTSCNNVDVDLNQFSPSFFNADEFSFLKEISSALLPETDTPGALTAGVPEMFDIMVNNVLKKDEQNEYRTNLTALRSFISGQLMTNDKEKIDDIISTLDSDLRLKKDVASDIRKTYMDVRGRTLKYYVGSEIVGTTLLNYLPVPGAYKPCIELSEVNGKAWAL